MAKNIKMLCRCFDEMSDEEFETTKMVYYFCVFSWRQFFWIKKDPV